MSEFIPLNVAIEMTTTYQQARSELVANNVSVDVLTISETFDKSQIIELLNQNDCTSMRAYFGMDDNRNVRLVLVGVDSKNKDILPQGNELIVERGIRCPITCPTDSPLYPTP